jgi:hypothetical protein
MEEINNIVRKFADHSSKMIPKSEKQAKMLLGRKGPVWYKGMVIDYKDYYKKMSQVDYLKVLEHFSVKNVFIGHIEVENISSDYKNSLIRVNVHQPRDKNSEKSQALFIENGIFYRVNGKGDRLVKLN